MQRAVRAVYLVFFGGGFAFASWASRIPQVRDGLRLDPKSLGLLLLSIAAGSVLALPLAGLVIARLGPARTVAVMATLCAAGLATAAIGFRSGVAPVVVGLFLLGVGNGTWDVAMNVEGTFVEQRLGRAIMPRFHAGFSIGTVAGALIGAGMVVLGVSVTAHLLAVAAVIAVGMPWAVRGFLTVTAPDHRDEQAPGHPLEAWRERRTLLLGLFVFCMAFMEGSANDWLGVAVIDGYHARAAVGSLTLGDVPRGDDDGPLVRPRAARSLRPHRQRAHELRARLRRSRAGDLRRLAAARDRRRRALGARERTRLPGRHECGR